MFFHCYVGLAEDKRVKIQSFVERSQRFVKGVKTCLLRPNYFAIQDIKIYQGVNAAIHRSSMPAYFGWCAGPKKTHKCERAALTALVPLQAQKNGKIGVWWQKVGQSLSLLQETCNIAIPYHSLVFKCSTHRCTDIEYLPGHPWVSIGFTCVGVPYWTYLSWLYIPIKSYLHDIPMMYPGAK